MNILHALVLGAVEGLTEFLPISSTAHLIIVSKLLGLADADFTKSFEIIIQLGAIAAVVSVYWKRFLTDWVTLKKLVVAFIPTGIVGFVLYPLIKGYFLGNLWLALAMLGLGGIFLMVFEYWYGKKIHARRVRTEMTYPAAFIIGCSQAVSVVPGVSRAAATIVGGLSLGFSREMIVEFSFLLAVPTMAAATGYDFLKNVHAFSLHDAGILGVGLIASFIVARIAITAFLRYIRRNTFVGFGIYRIVVAILGFIFIR